MSAVTWRLRRGRDESRLGRRRVQRGLEDLRDLAGLWGRAFLLNKAPGEKGTRREQVGAGYQGDTLGEK